MLRSSDIAEVEKAAAEARRLSRLPRRGAATQRTPAATRRGDEGLAYCAADLRASSQGRRLGRECGHDARALARRLRLPIEYVSPGAIDNPNKPCVAVLGRFVDFGDHPFIQIVTGLDGRNLNWTLAHECGHALGFPDERLCNQFASAFCKVADEELPGVQWRHWQKRQHDRLCRAVAVRSRP